MVALILDDLWGDVLWGTAESVGPIAGHESLDETEISNLDVPILLNKHVLWFQVSINQVLRVQVLKS